MRILGIDPGLQTTGFGVIDMDGQRLSYVASGTIRTNKMELGDLPGKEQITQFLRGRLTLGDNRQIPCRDPRRVVVLHQQAAMPGQIYSFRYFQALEGQVMLPPDFTPQRVRVLLDGEDVAVEQSFDWKIGNT